MDMRETWELLSYVVTVIFFPFALLVFIYEQRKERRNEDEEIFQRLSDEYREFLKLVLDNADLQLLRRQSVRRDLTEDQKERRLAIFGILISLFERAYLLVFEENMDRKTRRLWQSWEDYMREWVRREEFRDSLPQLLEGRALQPVQRQDLQQHVAQVRIDLRDQQHPSVRRLGDVRVQPADQV